jgi:hypothetical protein
MLRGFKENTAPVLLYDGIEYAEEARHKENTAPMFLVVCVEGLPSNGFICHNINYYARNIRKFNE